MAVVNFNTRFEAETNPPELPLEDTAGYFGKPSELVLDTNIYAYSLEYSMPSLFENLGAFYNILMPKLDFEPKYQMLELAGAYMKV